MVSKESIRYYQDLVNSGKVWQMTPDHIIRAIELIESGLVLRHQN